MNPGPCEPTCLLVQFLFCVLDRKREKERRKKRRNRKKEETSKPISCCRRCSRAVLGMDPRALCVARPVLHQLCHRLAPVSNAFKWWEKQHFVSNGHLLSAYNMQSTMLHKMTESLQEINNWKTGRTPVPQDLQSQQGVIEYVQTQFISQNNTEATFVGAWSSDKIGDFRNRYCGNF